MNNHRQTIEEYRNDPNRYRQSVEDWRWLTAEAEAADRRALVEEERRARPAGGAVFALMLCVMALLVVGAVYAATQLIWLRVLEAL